MTWNAKNGIATTSISALNGITLTSVSAANGITKVAASGSQPTFVQSQFLRVNGGTGSTNDITLPGATTAGNRALVMVMAENLTATVSDVTRGGASQGGAALISPQDVYQSPAQFRNHWFLTGALGAASTAFRVTMSASSNYDICVIELSGLHASSPLESSGLTARAVGDGSGSPPTPNTGNIVRTADKTIIFGAISGDGGANVSGANSFTMLHDGSWATSAFGLAYRQYTAAGTDYCGFTTSGGEWYRIGWIVLKGT